MSKVSELTSRVDTLTTAVEALLNATSKGATAKPRDTDLSIAADSMLRRAEVESVKADGWKNQEIASFANPRNSTSIYKLQLGVHGKTRNLGIREFYKAEDGDWLPGRKGIVLYDRDQAVRLGTALIQAAKKALASSESEI